MEWQKKLAFNVVGECDEEYSPSLRSKWLKNKPSSGSDLAAIHRVDEYIVPTVPNLDELQEIETLDDADEYPHVPSSKQPLSPTRIILENNIVEFLEAMGDDDDIEVHILDDNDEVESTTDDDDSIAWYGDISKTHALFLHSDRVTFRIPPEDKVSATEPSIKHMTTNYFQRCVGFRNTNSI